MADKISSHSSRNGGTLSELGENYLRLLGGHADIGSRSKMTHKQENDALRANAKAIEDFITAPGKPSCLDDEKLSEYDYTPFWWVGKTANDGDG